MANPAEINLVELVEQLKKMKPNKELIKKNQNSISDNNGGIIEF